MFAARRLPRLSLPWMLLGASFLVSGAAAFAQPTLLVPRPLSSDEEAIDWDEFTAPEAHPADNPQLPVWHAPPTSSTGVRFEPVNYPAELQTPPWETPSYATATREPLSPAALQPKSGRREGMFQRLSFTYTHLAGPNVSDLGVDTLDLSTTWAFPIPSRELPLIVTPRFATHYLHRPAGLDLPARLYDASLQLRTMKQLNEHWGMDIGVATGWYSDFQSSHEDALRITGHAFAAWDVSETTTWILGVVYLDWQSISLLPMAGLIYKPDADTRWELTFPKPRYSRRLWTDGWSEMRWYVAGELGGGRWAYESAGGDDVVSFLDYRVLLGWEYKTPGFLTTQLEVGYVFGRELEFQSGAPDLRPNDTYLLRAGFVF